MFAQLFFLEKSAFLKPFSQLMYIVFFGKPILNINFSLGRTLKMLENHYKEMFRKSPKMSNLNSSQFDEKNSG